MVETTWQKILYKNQGYPDNYTDKSFLLELKKNIKYKEVKFHEAILGASLVNQEVCTVIILLITYIYLYNEWLDPNVIFYSTGAVSAMGFGLYRICYTNSITETLGDDVRTVLIFLVFGHIFSPVLHTLTDTISTNTIYTMTFFMMLVHLIFFDYGISVAIVSNSFSLSAAVFASICLASRLATTYHGFVLITVAIELFVLFPLLRHKLKTQFIMSIFLISFVTFALSSVSTIVMLLFIALIFVTNIVCPLLFIRYQTFKDNIYGPWDEAIVYDADNINDLIYS